MGTLPAVSTASFGERLVALVIDFAITFGLVLALDQVDASDEWRFGVTAGYFVVGWSGFGGQTLGMRVCGISVVGTDGRGIGPLRAALRLVALVVGIGLWGGVAISVIFDAHSQGWHDKLARTFVIRRQDKSSWPPDAELAGTPARHGDREKVYPVTPSSSWEERAMVIGGVLLFLIFVTWLGAQVSGPPQR